MGANVDKDENRVFASIQNSTNLQHKHNSSCAEAGEHRHNMANSNGGDDYVLHYIFDTVDFCWKNHWRISETSILPAGSHTHNINIEMEGSKESRPVNKAVLYIIKV